MRFPTGFTATSSSLRRRSLSFVFAKNWCILFKKSTDSLLVNAKRQEYKMLEQHISSKNIASWRSFLKQCLLLLGALLVVSCAGPVSNTGPAVNKTVSRQTTTSTKNCGGTATTSQT